MSKPREFRIGRIEWRDLTVPNADEVRDFYRAVVGWESAAVDMGGYNDYFMTREETGETIAGVCHRRGGNADLPSLWLVYINVDDLQESLYQCQSLGGKVLTKIKAGPQGSYCVIEDPSGAVVALFEPPADDAEANGSD